MTPTVNPASCRVVALIKAWFMISLLAGTLPKAHASSVDPEPASAEAPWADDDGDDDLSLFAGEEPPFALGWDFAPIFSVINFGRPFGVSSSFAGVVGPQASCAKPVQWGSRCVGALLGAELGLGGARAGVGGAIVTAGEWHLGAMASFMRAWSHPSFFDDFPVQTYRGLEVIAGYDIYHLSLGTYWPVRGPEAKNAVYAWTLGTGF